MTSFSAASRIRSRVAVPSLAPLTCTRPNGLYKQTCSVCYEDPGRDHEPTEQSVTDGGPETDLIYHRGFELPDFAAFPLVEDERGRHVMTEYYDEYAAIAARAGVGLRLESPTWRANPDWAAGLGYDATRLAAVNRASIDLVRGVGERWTVRIGASS